MDNFDELVDRALEKGKLIKLTNNGAGWDVSLEEDIEEMSEEELKEYLTSLEQRLEELSDEEPEDDGSDEYETWADAHEDLEDCIDEVKELLEERRWD